MQKICRHITILCILPFLIFLSSCGGNSQNTERSVPVFNYPSYPALGITKPNSCTESIAPYFQQLGIQCRCNNYYDGYGYKTNEPGVTTRCMQPSDWLAQKRREEAAQNQQAREDQQRKIAADREWERTRPQREAQARYEAEQIRIRLNSICPVYYAARQSCATAAYYSSCMNIRLSNQYNEFDDRSCQSR
jgi:hypothetical protein